MSKQRAIKQIINTGPPSLRRLLDYARGIEEWNSRFQHMLPEPLSKHCSVANLRHQQLIVTVDSPAWGTRLRMLIPQLTAQLGENVEGITIRIAPLSQNGSHPRRTQRTAMSRETANLLRDCSQDLSDPGLRQALRRLARHAQDTS